MHSMNGFLYGNLPGLEMREGDTVRWHVAAYGTEVRDSHTLPTLLAVALCQMRWRCHPTCAFRCEDLLRCRDGQRAVMLRRIR